ncbi:hypothetical protein [Vibrio sp. MACH09]|uniref:hypothetical protein n=1 Tax=Vibrio sp. MACH09 TaxID=3025122 RepID=UPI00295E6D8D|nr:hypothetical protein [Vibrio sp. MACH09]
MIKVKRVLSLNPDYGLEKQFLFWVAVLLPITISVLLGVPVWTKYDLAFNAEAYEKFLKISKLPIGLASLSIPLGVLVSRLHSAKQTARQIENTQTQIRNTEQDNRTKLYLSHFEHFCTSVEFVEHSVCSRHKLLFLDNQHPKLDKLGMYKLLYPQNDLINGICDKGDHLKVFARNSMARFYRAYQELQYAKSYDDFVEKLSDLESGLINIQLRCFRFTNSRSSIFIKIETENITTDNFVCGVSPELSHYFAQVEFFLELLDGIESFDSPIDEIGVGKDILNRLRMPHSQKPEEQAELKGYWTEFMAQEKA